MDDIKVGRGSISAWTIFSCIGGFIILFGFFLGNVKVSLDYGLLDFETINVTGLDMFRNLYNGGPCEYSNLKWVPLIISMLGLLTAVFGSMPAFGIVNRTFKIASVITAVSAAVLAFVFMKVLLCPEIFTGDVYDYFISMGSDCKISTGVGPWFGVFGGIIAAASGIADCLNVRI